MGGAQGVPHVDACHTVRGRQRGDVVHRPDGQADEGRGDLTRPRANSLTAGLRRSGRAHDPQTELPGGQGSSSRHSAVQRATSDELRRWVARKLHGRHRSSLTLGLSSFAVHSDVERLRSSGVSAGSGAVTGIVTLRACLVPYRSDDARYVQRHVHNRDRRFLIHQLAHITLRATSKTAVQHPTSPLLPIAPTTDAVNQTSVHTATPPPPPPSPPRHHRRCCAATAAPVALSRPVRRAPRSVEQRWIGATPTGDTLAAQVTTRDGLSRDVT